MRVTSLTSLSVVVALTASGVSAGFLDRLTARAPSAVDVAAPSPPAGPSLDASGGSAAGGSVPVAVVQEPVQAGAPSVARGQGAVQTGEAAAAAAAVPTAVPVQAQELPYEGLEFKTPYFTVSMHAHCEPVSCGLPLIPTSPLLADPPR